MKYTESVDVLAMFNDSTAFGANVQYTQHISISICRHFSLFITITEVYKNWKVTKLQRSITTVT